MVKKSSIAFMSYAHLDNRRDQLTAFSELLADEVLVQTGEQFHIFQDRKDIKWGQNWQERIEESLDRVTFLIAFITPSYFRSQACRNELQRFLKREEVLGRNDLILPVYYVDCKQFADEELLEEDVLAKAIFERQYVDWRDLRFQQIDSLQIHERMSLLAGQIRDALWRVKESDASQSEKSISQQFAEQIKDVPLEKAYSFITEYTSQLLSSKRTSLMGHDENQGTLLVHAAIGPHASKIISYHIPLDAGVSGIVMRNGRPVVVSDVSLSEYKQAPTEYGYETNSFICFPIILRGKSSFILNFTDKADVGTYNESDLRILEAIAPHIALALDRTRWHQKATQFEVLSIKEPVATGEITAGERETVPTESGAGGGENVLDGERESRAEDRETPADTFKGSVDEEWRKADRLGGGTPAATDQPGMITPAATLAEACVRAVKTLGEAQGVKSLSLMLRADGNFYPACTTGGFDKKPPRLTLEPEEISSLLAATHDDSISVSAGGGTPSGLEDMVELFPLLVGEEVKGALMVGDSRLSEKQRLAIAAFCRGISVPLEVLRLREELERRAQAATFLRAFTEVVNAAQPEDIYAIILRHSAELLHAERGSLLLFDESAGELSVKAAFGPYVEAAREVRLALGEGVAGSVLLEGRAMVVRDVAKVPGFRPTTVERGYKTNSFISYPLVIGGRKLGVLNLTDKAGGGVYDEVDLSLLDTIAPQMALALDRAQWHQKATQFQLLSITDPLTGLLNRRYLEERLSEEVERTKRYRYAMSFMMIDIDDFKHYNDVNGHLAGDLALEITAQCLKATLRSADVASRYGGEEFSILLPQTSISEAGVIAERIRRRIERMQFPHGKEQPTGRVTVSIGISAFGPGVDTPASIIYAADQALHMAKSRGKNCVQANS